MENIFKIITCKANTNVVVNMSREVRELLVDLLYLDQYNWKWMPPDWVKLFLSLFIDIHIPLLWMTLISFWNKKLVNAGCYLCSYLILSLPSLKKCTGLKIIRYDFNDPQAGMEVCDRKIATDSEESCVSI